MARPDGAETRTRILRTALPLFAARGFDGTSVRDVAGAAGVNVATLAWHFGDKQGLYDAIIQATYASLADLVLEPEELRDDPLTAAVARGWRFLRDHELEVKMLHRHLLDQGEHSTGAEGPQLQVALARSDEILGLLRPDWTVAERRVLLFTIVHLLVRFALEPQSELKRLYGIEGDRDELVVRWVTRVARRALTDEESPLAVVGASVRASEA